MPVVFVKDPHLNSRQDVKVEHLKATSVSSLKTDIARKKGVGTDEISESKQWPHPLIFDSKSTLLPKKKRKIYILQKKMYFLNQYFINSVNVWRTSLET